MTDQMTLLLTQQIAQSDGQIDWLVLLPVFAVVVWAVGLLVADLWIPARRKGITAALAALGLVIALGLTLASAGKSGLGFYGMLVLDAFAVVTNALILASALLAIPLAYDYLKRTGIEKGEYYVLILLSTAGMMLMVQAYDLIVVFLAMELLSIPLYVLAGFARPRLTSEEAALKYFLLGAFASAFLLYGIAMVYGGTAHTDFEGIFAVLNSTIPYPFLFAVGAGLVLVGLAFKISAVPFHVWTPDVYQGAPTPVTGFMAVSVKVAGVAALLRLLISIFPGITADLGPVLGTLAVVTVIVGNLLAVVQNNVKRLLAYSSISNVGYLLLAVTAYADQKVMPDVIASSLFFLAAYGLASFAAWAVVIAAEKPEGDGVTLEDLAGLGRKAPWLGLAMIIAMLSFTGIPLTLGFWGKFYLFRTVIEAGALPLALTGLVASLFSAYYYLRILVVMYMRPGDPQVYGDRWLQTTALVSALAVLLLSFFPSPLFQWVAQAVLR